MQHLNHIPLSKVIQINSKEVKSEQTEYHYYQKFLLIVVHKYVHLQYKYRPSIILEFSGTNSVASILLKNIIFYITCPISWTRTQSSITIFQKHNI